jgi:hypothetical protein
MPDIMQHSGNYGFIPKVSIADMTEDADSSVCREAWQLPIAPSE